MFPRIKSLASLSLVLPEHQMSLHLAQFEYTESHDLYMYMYIHMYTALCNMPRNYMYVHPCGLRAHENVTIHNPLPLSQYHLAYF